MRRSSGRLSFKREMCIRDRANTIQQLEWGGQYSSENKEWASRIYIPPDKSHNLNFVVPIRSAVLNGVVNQYRAAYQALGLFSPNQCEPDSFEKLDYEGKVLVLSPDTLKESCWKPENQLWYAHDAVSYTHLDVYKRQPQNSRWKFGMAVSGV